MSYRGSRKGNHANKPRQPTISGYNKNLKHQQPNENVQPLKTAFENPNRRSKTTELSSSVALKADQQQKEKPQESASKVTFEKQENTPAVNETQTKDETNST